MAKLRFTLGIGRLICDQVKSELKNAAFMRGMKVTIEEDEGFFESNLRVLFEGTDEQVLALKPQVEDYFDRLKKAMS
jgi:hypothetical protein